MAERDRSASGVSTNKIEPIVQEGHRLVAVETRVPGREPSDVTLDELRPRGYPTRFWRCRRCGRERSRREDFRRPCAVAANGDDEASGGEARDDESKVSPRTRRAIREDMTVERRTGARYTVVGESGTEYLVDIAAWTCSYPDFRERAPEDGCKHLQRVDLDVRAGNVPRPDGEHMR